MDRASIIAIEEVCKRCNLYTKHCGMLGYPSQCVDSGHFIDGYRKAEKDLALTWKDVAKIITIYEAGIDNGDYRRYNEAEWMKEYSQDILRRFNEIRKNYKLETENELHRL